MSAASVVEYPEKIDVAVLKVAGVIVIGAIMSILDITVVNVALPTFTTIFAEDPAQPLAYSTVAWTVTAYTLALATVIPLTGWAADRFGTKRLYMLAVVLFTAGSALCAVATSIGMLIGFRTLQGLGGGMLMPLGMTIMTRAAGPKRMGRLMAILGVPMLLALFLYGVSSIPGERTMNSPKVYVTMALGFLLISVFVRHTFRPAHPLLDLRLFRDRNLRVATITMFLFGAAFFGGLLLVPTYFQQIRGESTMHAGLLVAPQGIGAMLTTPIAGALSDKVPVGRIVPFGLLLITGGMFALTQITSTTTYPQLIVTLFVMGLGMGATMMPIMTSALKTLTSHEVARGSTLLNIVQQIASSVGVAVMSVLLTNHLNDSPLAGPAILSWQDPRVAQQIGGPAGVAEGLAEGAQAFASTYRVAAFLVALTLVPTLFLPRRHEESHLLDDVDPGAPSIIAH
jgi:MFS family permease